MLRIIREYLSKIKLLLIKRYLGEILKINIIHILFRVTVTFVKANGERIKAKGEIGNSILDIVVNNDLELDGYGMNVLYKNLFVLNNCAQV